MSKDGRGSAFKEELNCSDDLRTLIKKKKVTRGKSMKYVWRYIKKHKLQDKKDKRTIKPDEKLAAITGKKPFNMMKLGKMVFAQLESNKKKTKRNK